MFCCGPCVWHQLLGLHTQGVPEIPEYSCAVCKRCCLSTKWQYVGYNFLGAAAVADTVAQALHAGLMHTSQRLLTVTLKSEL
jgi:hypothetical protein